jgi:hypothetical protein
MELKLRFIFIISCWPSGPTPYGITRGPDWGYLGDDKFERGLSQVPGPTRIRPEFRQASVRTKSVYNSFCVNSELPSTFFKWDLIDFMLASHRPPIWGDLAGMKYQFIPMFVNSV